MDKIRIQFTCFEFYSTHSRCRGDFCSRRASIRNGRLRKGVSALVARNDGSRSRSIGAQQG